MLVATTAVAVPLALSAGSDGHGSALLPLAAGLLVLFFARTRSLPQPRTWTWCAGVFGLILGGALGGAVAASDAGPTSPALLVVVILGPALVATLLAYRAYRVILHPMVPALGASDLDLSFGIRADVPNAGVAIRGGILQIEVSDDWMGRSFRRHRIPLSTIHSVTLRPVSPADGVWLADRNHRPLRVPPGEVVELLHQPPGLSLQTQLLPVKDGAGFVGVLRARIEHLRARGVIGVPSRAPAAARAPRPPGPAPTGPRVIPVPPRPADTGRPPAIRFVIAAVLGALAVLTIPTVELALTDLAATERGIGWAWVGVGALCWALMRGTPRRWPGCALVSGLYPALMTLADGLWWLAPIAVALGVLAVLGAGRVLVTPPHPDLGDGEMELMVAVRSGHVLLLGRDRLMLRLRRPRPHTLPHGLPMGCIDLVQPGELTEASRYPMPGEPAATIPPGPALRITGCGQQWLLGVDDPMTLAEIVRRRCVRVGPASHPVADPTPVVDPLQWRELRAWASRIRTGWQRDSRWGKTRTPDRWVWTALPLAVGGSMTVAEGGSTTVAGAVLFALAMAIVARYAWIRPRMRRAENQPLEPGSPPWGEQRPDHAPVRGWVPWR